MPLGQGSAYALRARYLRCRQLLAHAARTVPWHRLWPLATLCERRCDP
ncbi:MAG: hypothetical protein F6K26_39605 [Moorea sp. SIO2I5]|nr:hypothetical protein [Moorena sp. SIO2I5]